MSDVMPKRKTGPGCVTLVLQQSMHLIVGDRSGMSLEHFDQRGDRLGIGRRANTHRVDLFQNPKSAFEIIFDVSRENDNRGKLSGDLIVQSQRRINDTFRTLRSKFEVVYSANEGQFGAAVLALKETERQATDAIIDMSRPRPGKAMIDGILGNLPLPGVNPFSIIISLKSFFSEVQKADQFDWLYMLRDLREK